MKRPNLAVVPLVDRQRQSYWMLPGYLLGLEQAGGLPVMLPLTEDRTAIAAFAAQYDGFLFPGGQDVCPRLYGEEPSPQCGEQCPARDTMEQALLHAALRLDKPVLGICRGLQLMNVLLGGTLWQDLPTGCPSPVCHCQRPPYDRPVHTVTLCPGTPLHALLRTDTLPVNSYHHQGVRRLAPALRAMALAEDGLVEAAYLPQARFAWAVQWHPEFSHETDAASRALLRAFVEAAARP